MKFDYNFEQDYFKKYNEANGAAYMVKRLTKNPKLKVNKYLSYILANCLWIFMAGLLINMLATFTTFTFLSEIGEFFMYLAIILYLVLLIWLFACSKLEINSKKGSIVINEEGITDENANGNKMMFSYNNLKMVIVTKNLIVFSLNNPIMLFIPNNNKGEVIATLKKYSDVQIIHNN